MLKNLNCSCLLFEDSKLTVLKALHRFLFVTYSSYIFLRRGGREREGEREQFEKEGGNLSDNCYVNLLNVLK